MKTETETVKHVAAQLIFPSMFPLKGQTVK